MLKSHRIQLEIEINGKIASFETVSFYLVLWRDGFNTIMNEWLSNHQLTLW